MKLFNILLWLAAYSVCLVHIILFALVYYKYKNKTELRFLYILSNVLIITGIIMILNQTVTDRKVYNLILTNSLLSLFITVPCFVYKSNAVARKYYFVIPLTILIAAFLYNFLILLDRAALASAASPVFFMILFSPIFPNFSKKNAVFIENNDIRNLGRTGVIMFSIALFFTLTAFLLNKLTVRRPYLVSIYFALFTMTYQIPGFLYCKNRLRHFKKNINLSQLTKREKEVVTEICSGLKYEEIADKLSVSLSAVKKHTYNIYRKLEIKNNRELMLLVNNAKEP